MNHQELMLVLTLISGFVVGFFVEYVHNHFSEKRSRKEEFLPYLLKLYRSVSRIMDNTDAQELSRNYERLMNATIEKKMRESAIRELTGKEEIKLYEWMRPTSYVWITFLFSYNSLIEVIRECNRFETVYMKMEKEGLMHALKLHHGRLYNRLSFFHSSASYIVKETNEIVGNLVKSNELKKEQGIEAIFEDEIFGILLGLSTGNLFRFGSQLEKQLRKQI